MSKAKHILIWAMGISPYRAKIFLGNRSSNDWVIIAPGQMGGWLLTIDQMGHQLNWPITGVKLRNRGDLAMLIRRLPVMERYPNIFFRFVLFGISKYQIPKYVRAFYNNMFKLQLVSLLAQMQWYSFIWPYGNGNFGIQVHFKVYTYWDVIIELSIITCQNSYLVQRSYHIYHEA